MKKKCGAFALVALALAFGLTACTEPGSLSSASSSPVSSSSSSSSSELIMEGDGTKANPYLPLTAEHLVSLSSKVVSTDTTYIKLVADIDLGGREWTPFGSKVDVSSLAKVNFDGNGHAIKGLSITEANDEKSGVYGLFGIVSGYIHGLTVEGKISVVANSESAYAGLLAGIAYNCEINDCHAKGDVEIQDNGGVQSESSSAGGLVGSFQTVDSYYASLSGSSAEGDVISFASLGDAGGLVGTMTTSASSLGIGSLNSNVVKSDAVVGSVDAGGILGSSYYYASIVNNIADIKSVSTASAFNGAAFAGGIIGSTYYEDAFLYNIAKVAFVDGGKKATASCVGDVTGDVMDDGYAAGSTVEGSAVYGNLSLGSALAGTNKNPTAATDLSALKAEDFAAIGFVSDVWTLTDGALPVLKDGGAVSSEKKGNGTIKANYEGGDDETLAYTTGTFNQGFKSANTSRTDGYTFIDTCYDQSGSVSYRWYAPLNVFPTLYNNWFDASTIAGFHLGADSSNPVFDFKADGTLVTIFSDYETDTTGTWWSNGEYIVFNNKYYEDCVASIDGASFSFADANADEYTYKYAPAPIDYGYYKDEDGHMLFLQGNDVAIYTDGMSKFSIKYTVNDGVITLALSSIGYEDVPIVNNADGTISIAFNDPDSPFTLTLKKSDGVPDYVSSGIAGTYSGNVKFDIKLSADGNMECYRPDSTSVYGSGGFRVYGTAVEIRADATPGVAGNFVFNPSKSVLVKEDGSVIFSKSGTYVSTYATSDGNVRIFAFSDANYLVINSKLDTSLTVSGTLANGETIQIGEDEYAISGTTLTRVASAPDVTPLVNTYTGTVNSQKIELVLNANKTGTYGGTAINYAFDGTTVTFTVGSLSVSLAWDATAKTLTGSVVDDDEGYNWDVVFSVKSTDPVTKSGIGTFSGSGFGDTVWNVTVNSNNTLTVKVDETLYSGTWSGDASTSILSTDLKDKDGSVFNSDDGLTFAYSSSKDALEVSFTQDYDDYSFTFTRA